MVGETAVVGEGAPLAAEIDGLRAEAAAVEPAPADAGAEPAPASEPPPFDRAGMVAMIGQGVAAIGGIVCRRARVTPLEPGEVEAVASALANLAAVYDLGRNLDPRTAAWCGLGLALAGVAARRERLSAPEPAPEPERAPAPVAAAPAAVPGETFPLSASQDYAGA